jgi:hypothetical protein
VTDSSLVTRISIRIHGGTFSEAISL